MHFGIAFEDVLCSVDPEELQNFANFINFWGTFFQEQFYFSLELYITTRALLFFFSFCLISIRSPSFPLEAGCFCKLIKIDFSHFFLLVFRVEVETNVGIFRAFYATCFPFSLSCMLLLIQTERTIHYKILFHNERHSFRGNRVKAQHNRKVYFLSFFFIVRLYRSG